MNIQKAPIIGIDRHRFLTDGEGVTTLVVFHGCPLDCKYCLNPECKTNAERHESFTPQQLYDKVQIDDLYFRVTGGGVVFGGGEPLLQSRFIEEFNDICGDKWSIYIETSLNVDQCHVERLVSIVDSWIIDIKDWNNDIYRNYTTCHNFVVKRNLKYLLSNVDPGKIQIRVPLIPYYNTIGDTEHTIAELHKLGITDIDKFKYKKDVASLKEKIHKKNNQIPTPDPDSINMGKFRCEVLKSIRVHAAECNNIPYTPHECPNNMCATGFCPICDNELKRITNEYYKQIKIK